MRQIKFAMILMLSVFVCAHMHAQESVDHEGISRGRFTVSVTERSRLSDVKVFMRRFGWLPSHALAPRDSSPPFRFDSDDSY